MKILISLRAPWLGKMDMTLRLSALEAAVHMAEKYPEARIYALAVDEPGGEEAVRSCLAHVAERAYLARGAAVDPIDAVAAGLLMAQAVETIERREGPFDLIFCGDAEPGQDGLAPALAGYLNRMQVTGVSEVEPEDSGFLVRRRWDEELAAIRVNGPCVLSFLQPTGPAIYPKLSRLMEANLADVEVIETAAAPQAGQAVLFNTRPRTVRMLEATDPDTMPELADLLIGKLTT